MVSSVLIVDDDAAFLALAARVLEEMGVKAVSTAPDAAAAVVAAHEKRPEAVLVDVGLPDRDGIDLARHLAALPWSPRAMLTSTDPDAARVVEAQRADGVLPFIAKEDLASGALQRWLAGE
jgi:CheY-like chemotaxis protein